MNSRDFTSGLTIENILKMDVANLTTDQLRAVTTRLGSAANKRLKRMEKAGIESTATRSVKRSGGKISVKGKASRKDVRAEYNRAKKFLTSKSSSVSSAKKKGKGKKKTSYKDIINKDVNKMSEDELRKNTQRLISVAKGRLKKLKEKDVETPAMLSLLEGGDLGTKGKNLNELRSEFSRVRNFLNSETSSYSGYMKMKNATIKELKNEYNINISGDEWDVFWRSFEELKRIDPTVAVRGLKYETLQAVSDMMKSTPDVKPGEIAYKVSSRIADIYEQRESAASDNNGVSRFIKPQ